MMVDLSISISKSIWEKTFKKEWVAAFGHLGTHFDVMDKEFPLAYTERSGIVFDISQVSDRDITEQDIDIERVKEDMFVAFYSNFIEKVPYGTPAYFSGHPQLSDHLIDILLQKRISIIGLDFAGLRRGKEHTPKDQVCSDHGVFVVENLCNLDQLLMGKQNSYFIAHTYPIKFEGLTGLPCRVVGSTL